MAFFIGAVYFYLLTCLLNAQCVTRVVCDRSKGAMNRHVTNPASDYYHFVFEPDDDDDDGGGDFLPPNSPVDEDPELLPEM